MPASRSGYIAAATSLRVAITRGRAVSDIVTLHSTRQGDVPPCRSRPARILLASAPVLVAGALSGCGQGVLDPAGPVGAGDRMILLDALAIMLVIVIPTILCTLAFAWRYRAGNRRATYTPGWAYSGRLGAPRLGHSGVRRDLSWRTSPGSARRARSRQAAAVATGAARGRCRLARLEVALHLPHRAPRKHQPAGRPHRQAGAPAASPRRRCSTCSSYRSSAARSMR